MILLPQALLLLLLLLLLLKLLKLALKLLTLMTDMEQALEQQFGRDIVLRYTNDIRIAKHMGLVLHGDLHVHTNACLASQANASIYKQCSSIQ